MNQFRNILIAEDDTDDYLFFIEALEKISPPCKATRAKNGLECITLLKTTEKPDVIFLDLNMPIKNGLDCVKFIKDKEELKSIPVIIYSTSHYIKDIDACFKNNAHYYIIKPVAHEMLVEVLHIVLTRLRNSLERPDIQNFVVRIATSVES